ncbi:MAG: hypothetical protein Q4C71_02425 [Microbacteriaceae bacterium]|nr:hypothetical protein [Microbacteriaceae bacterium]
MMKKFSGFFGRFTGKAVFAAAFAASIALAGCATEKTPAQQSGEKQGQQKPQPLTQYDSGKIYRMDQRPVLPVGSLVAAEPPETDVQLPDSTKIQVVVAASEKQEEVAPLKAELERQLGQKVKINTIPRNGFDEFRAIMSQKPDMVFTIGTEILGLTDSISTQYIRTTIVTLGGQIAEPTKNVNAVVWPGATSRAAVVTEKMEFGNSAKWAKDAVRMGLLAWLEEEPGMVYVLGAKAE